MGKMELEEVRAYIADQTWTFAKSYPKAPHWYIVRETSQHRDKFEEFVDFIREFGREEKFWRTTYVYLYLDGYKYWSIENIINRAEAK